MEQIDILYAIADLFEKHHISYLLTGSFASAYYAHPRSTHDIDLILAVEQAGSMKMIEAFKELDTSYVIPFTAIPQTMKSKGQFDIFHEGTSTKVDFWIVESDQFVDDYQRRHIVAMDGHRIPIISAEDLILTKLKWSKQIMSERHVRDCAGILAIQKDMLDYSYLNAQIKKHGLEKLYQLALKTEYQKT